MNIKLIKSDSYIDDKNYLPAKTLAEWVDEWSFKKANTAIYTHKIHRYPAMFIPQLVRKVIEEYTSVGDTVLDIFNGSGSTMVECCLTGRNSVGIEINPLANLIAKVKTTRIDCDVLAQHFLTIKNDFNNDNFKYELVEFNNIDFWFDLSVKKHISKLLKSINSIGEVDAIDFFKVCLSEIIRNVSVCNHSGFKMHRDIKKVGVEILADKFFNMYQVTYEKNVASLSDFNSVSSQHNVTNRLITGCSTDLQKSIDKGSVDLILTSPPYGDSSTTVAYGQFSRLSSQFFGLQLDGLNDIAYLDNKLLGGARLDKQHYANLLTNSLTLTNVYDFFTAKIDSDATSDVDKKKLIARLNDVLSFYYDLDKCLENGAYYLKDNKHFVLVTGSRVVKMIKLHTDLIIAELAERFDLQLSAIFYRNIENKRMPSKVSATNITGEKAPTMTRESIIVLKKYSK